ncbi:MAG TPA: TlpA disulfide reductase family protein, partial [Sphingobacteriaceae bacterium]
KVKRANAMAKPQVSPYFETGKRLKDFSVRDLDGNKYKLKDLAGKVVVLNFWFINCAPCRMEIPDLNKVVTKYKNNTDVVFLGIALDDARSLEDFLKDTPFNYNIVSDGRYEASMYGVKSYPTHVILDRKSNIIFHTHGLAANTVHWIDKSIAEGLTGRP